MESNTLVICDKAEVCGEASECFHAKPHLAHTSCTWAITCATEQGEFKGSCVPIEVEGDIPE